MHPIYFLIQCSIINSDFTRFFAFSYRVDWQIGQLLKVYTNIFRACVTLTSRLIKNEENFFLKYIGKFRGIRLMASSYMVKYLRISSYIRKLFRALQLRPIYIRQNSFMWQKLIEGSQYLLIVIFIYNIPLYIILQFSSACAMCIYREYICLILSTIYCQCTCIFTVLRTTLLILKK